MFLLRVERNLSLTRRGMHSFSIGEEICQHVFKVFLSVVFSQLHSSFLFKIFFQHNGLQTTPSAKQQTVLFLPSGNTEA